MSILDKIRQILSRIILKVSAVLPKYVIYDPRNFSGFSSTVGRGVSPMKNVIGLDLPEQTETDLHFEGLRRRFIDSSFAFISCMSF